MADELHEDVHINEDVYIGRQPIYNAKLELVGYELLYRDNSNNNANFNDGDYASSQVIINTFMELGLENIVGSSLAFINLTRGFFNGDQPFPLAKEQVVLEFLEDIDPDQTVLDGLTQLRENGFRIALDDYIYDDQHKVLLDYADIVKVDVAHVSDEQLPELVALYKERGATLLAEKVESYGQFTRCQALGFNYFQGYFFCKPKIIQGKQLPSNRIAVMNLLAEVQNPEVEISTLEEKITNNVTLSFRLLRYINCASFALRREVESVHQAIVLLGLQNIKNWLSLMLMAKGGNDKPHELMTTALLRARMCETLAADQGLVREQAFTVGLFSVLDALMDQPMDDLLDNMPLSGDTKMALLDHEGALGEILQGVLAYERNDLFSLHSTGLSIEHCREHYLRALPWADETSHSLYEAAPAGK
ncbi:hypothetical protein BOW53_13520 [Solemya pervernicosa gill symbiont]|uniref:HDOD domain-containing protein n=1 Tax=Solemya pervernicosa gill symbiont TaxID=642797 RepID=A0A1T2L1M2_9GAMM|nr:HDOD domain-containing protein [Solemya pervernicosa gill symbiont]OOZ38971.1 hypothetical protein BOW53_13520 [Solemya pervernicosa gill symbiont]